MTTIIYHDKCSDGAAAGWAARLAYPHATMIPANHDGAWSTQVQCFDDDLIFIDFAPTPDELDRLLGLGATVYIYDHHKTAEQNLAGRNDFAGVIDRSRSGAQIAWDELVAPAMYQDGSHDGFYRNPTTKRPWVIDLVADRDLWEWQYKSTREFSLGLGRPSIQMIDYCAGGELLEIIKQGEAVTDYVDGLLDSAAERARRCWVAGYPVPIVNALPAIASELGHQLAEGEPFVVIWWQNADGSIQLSFRSQGPTGEDVSEIAKQFGGGGHPPAAGARVPWGTSFPFEPAE